MSDYKVQANATIGGVLFNVNGDSADEVLAHLKTLAAAAPEVFTHFNALSDGAKASQVFAARASTATPDVAVNASTPPPAAAAPAGPPAAGTPSCVHGPMKDCLGMTTKAGNLYKNRYYCTDQGPTKCKTGVGTQ